MSQSPYFTRSAIEFDVTPQTRTFAPVLRVLRELVSTVVPAMLVALLIHVFVAQATQVYGQSMEPNLHQDQRLVIEKISYRLHSPQRGDVVVVRPVTNGGDMLIKRIIALPGERVETHNGRVYVDGLMLAESYLSQATQGLFQPVVVPPLHVFVMGDNRSASNDSRAFGPVAISDIVGHAWVQYWPLNSAGPIQ